MAVPTLKEQELLVKFRENIKDLDLKEWQDEDSFLLRWIRARENNLTKAEDMLRKSLTWREKNDIDNISNWNAPEEYAREFPFDILGFDSEGSPVAIFPLGIWDVRRRIDMGDRETYIRYVDKIYSTIFDKLREKEALQNDQTQFVVIVDMKGFSIKQFASPSAVETVLETFRRFEANFPESLKQAYTINAPRIFDMAFSLVKPLLSGRTLQKIQIFNSNADKWQPVLKSQIPLNVLPVSCGGTFCRNNTNECYENISTVTSKDGLMEVNVIAGGKLLLEFDIESSNSILRWEFEIVSFDIGFSIIFGDAEKVVYSYERYDSDVKKVEGSLVCGQPGTYTLVFDNSYSRMRSKQLKYLATVHPPIDVSDDEDDLSVSHL